MASDVEHFFIYLWTTYILLGKVSIQVFYPFFNWSICLPNMKSYDFFIYFGNQTLVRSIIGKCVFPFSWFLFHFADFFLAVQKLFNLMLSHLFILCFISLTLGHISVKILLHGISEIFLPMFSSRTFMMSRLIFKSFIHLEFIFVYGVSWWSSFIFFMHLSRSLNTIYWREYLYSILCSWPHCQILSDHRDLNLFLFWISLFKFISVLLIYTANLKKIRDYMAGSFFPLTPVYTSKTLCFDASILNPGPEI